MPRSAIERLLVVGVVLSLLLLAAGLQPGSAGAETDCVINSDGSALCTTCTSAGGGTTCITDAIEPPGPQPDLTQPGQEPPSAQIPSDQAPPSTSADEILNDIFVNTLRARAIIGIIVAIGSGSLADPVILINKCIIPGTLPPPECGVPVEQV